MASSGPVSTASIAPALPALFAPILLNDLLALLLPIGPHFPACSGISASKRPLLADITPDNTRRQEFGENSGTNVLLILAASLHTTDICQNLQYGSLLF